MKTQQEQTDGKESCCVTEYLTLSCEALLGLNQVNQKSIDQGVEKTKLIFGEFSLLCVET